MPVIAIINQKGGCGKTVTAVSLAASLAANRKKILLIDLDPQGHASLSFGIDPQQGHTIFDVLDLNENKNLQDIITILSPHLHLAPANISLSILEQKLAGKHGREIRLLDKLSRIRKLYDYIVIDCPPNLGLLTINALIAAQRLIVPVDTSIFSLHGIEKLQATVSMLKNKIGHDPDVYGLATIFDQRTNFSKIFLLKLKKVFGDKLFKTVIPNSIKFREASESATAIIDYAPRSKGAQTYLGLAAEILRRDKHKVIQKAVRSKKTARAANGPKHITFTFPNHNGVQKVQIAAEFNGWNPAFGKLKKSKECWLATFPLKPGRHEYKYLVNGEWMLDPENNHKVKTALGVFNSVIMVE
jgi:chromosome partitioning protein